MAQFFVHIGMHKTGTSSIQHNFFNYRDFLLARGVNYPGLHANHGVLLFSMLSDQPHRYQANVRQGINTPEKAARHNERVRAAFQKELRTNPAPKVVISGEALSLLDDTKVIELKQLLQPYATSIRIVIYVRDPLGFMNSAMQQRIKQGASLDRLSGDLRLPRYRERIEKYIRVFGAANVDIRIFDSELLVAGDVVTDFLVAIGESSTLFEGRELVRVNESISHEAAVIFDQANRLVPVFKNHAPNPDRANLEKWLSQIKGEKLVLAPLIDEDTRAAITADLEWLHGMLGKPVFSLEPQAPSIARWNEETMASMARLFNAMAGVHDQEAEQVSRRRFGMQRLIRRLFARDALG